MTSITRNAWPRIREHFQTIQDLALTSFIKDEVAWLRPLKPGALRLLEFLLHFYMLQLMAFEIISMALAAFGFLYLLTLVVDGPTSVAIRMLAIFYIPFFIFVLYFCQRTCAHTINIHLAFVKKRLVEWSTPWKREARKRERKYQRVRELKAETCLICRLPLSEASEYLEETASTKTYATCLSGCGGHYHGPCWVFAIHTAIWNTTPPRCPLCRRIGYVVISDDIQLKSHVVGIQSQMRWKHTEG